MFKNISEDDFDLVYSIYMEDAINPYMSFEKQSKLEFRECFSVLRSRDKFIFFVEKGENVGIVTVVQGKWRKRHVVTIGGLAVPSAYQGKGVATRMIKALIENLKTEGFTRIELFVESDNPKAIALYQKLGFKKEGVLRNYFKREADSAPTDEIIMAKIIL